jgi:vancomycin resistance protein YoaR
MTDPTDPIEPPEAVVEPGPQPEPAPAAESAPEPEPALDSMVVPEPEAEPVVAPGPEPDVEPELHHRSARLSFGLAFVLGLAAALLLGVGALYAYDRHFADRILPGVHVGSVDLSGLDADEARAALQATYGTLGVGRLVITGAAGEHDISYADVGRGPDIDAMLEEAIAVGRSGSPVDRAVADARTVVRGVYLEPRVTFNANELAAQVMAVADLVRTDPKEAKVAIDAQGAFRIIDGAQGRTADPGAVIGAFTTALAEVRAPAELSAELRLSTVDPAVTTDKARNAAAQAERLTAPIVLVVGEDEFTIESAELRRWVTFTSTSDGAYGPVLDSRPLTKVVKAFAPKIDREAVNATFTIVGGMISSVTPSKDGHKLDTAATVSQIQALLSGRKAGFAATQVIPTLAVTTPSLTTAQAEAAAPQMTLISSWKTYFPISERNGFGGNIWIPALTIDGTVVGPHETFDFWNAIGPVTREKGYVDGGAIINGKTEPQGALAGGICSCSTTLFNAVLRGGFQMGARRNHFYYIDRYPLGLDATVFISASGATQTMSWTNDTDYPVLIRGYKIRDGSRGYVKFELYSVPNGRTVVISDPIVKNVKPATDTTQLTTTLPTGVRQRVEFPVDGKQVWRTVTVYDAAGAILHQTTYYSNYSRITGLTLIGAPAASTAAAEPTAAP